MLSNSICTCYDNGVSEKKTNLGGMSKKLSL